MPKRSLALVPVALIGGCVGAPPPPQTPLRRAPPVTLRTEPPSASLADRPFTPGSWRYGRGVARFGEPQLFEARCEVETRRVTLTAAGPRATAMTLRASTTARTVAASATATATGTVATVAATDPILDALAFSRGSFAVQAGSTILTLPTWPQFSRVIEDCRA